MQSPCLRAAFRLFFGALLACGGAASAFAQAQALQPGRVAFREIPEVVSPELFSGVRGFFLDVGEEVIRVEIRLSTAPGESNMGMFVRFGQDVSRRADGTLAFDFASDRVGAVRSVVIDESTTPRIQPGRWFVALEAGFRNPRTFVFIETSVTLRAGAADLRRLAASDFETGLPQGWTRNFPAPDPFVDGATTGNANSTLEVLRVDNRTHVLRLTGTGEDAFVAPPEYLGKLALLGQSARIEFDLAYDADQPARQPIEVRMMGGGGTWRWQGPLPTELFQRVSIPIQDGVWRRVAGSGSFEALLQDVLRIEIRAVFDEVGGRALLDNVVLLGKAERPALPAFSGFDRDREGWLPNVPDAPTLQPRILGATEGDFRTARNGVSWLATNGNPGGYLLVNDIEDVRRDALVAPNRYLGDLAALGPQARIEFDRRHVSLPGASRGVEVRLIGFGGAYAWVGPPPPPNAWTRYVAPLRADRWSLVAGSRTFEEVLRAVQRIEVTMDEVAGPEENGIDNFEFVVPAPLTPQLSASPQSLVFNATEGFAPPPPRIVTLESNGPELEWFAAASPGATWLRFSRTQGEAPGEVAVSVNLSGLPPGLYQGSIEFAWLGSTSTVRIPVTLNLVSATAPLVSQGGIRNAASFAANDQPGGELAGGMFVAIFGQRMAARTEQASTVPLPTSLGGTSVSIGGIPAPLVFASDLQINAVVPQSLTQAAAAAQGVSQADVIVVRDGVTSPPERIRLAPLRPVLFSQDQRGSGPGAIQNVLGGGQVQLNTYNDPARPLQTVTIYGSGFGPTQKPVLDGFAAVAPNSLRGSARVRVRVGGVDANILYAGLTVGLPHLYQINATLAANTPLGCDIPLLVSIDGVESNTVTLAVTRNGEPCR